MPSQAKWEQIKKYIKDAYSISSLEMLIPGTVGYKLRHLPHFTLEAKPIPATSINEDVYEGVPLFKLANVPASETGKKKAPKIKPECKMNTDGECNKPKKPVIQEEPDFRYSINADSNVDERVRYSIAPSDNTQESFAEHIKEFIKAGSPSIEDYFGNSANIANTSKVSRNLGSSLKLDISFFESVEEWLEKKKINHVDFYNYSNISRQTYYRMKTQLGKPPTKAIALACVVGLELTISEANELLKKAGLSLSNSNITDVVVQAFLSVGEYDIDLINETILYFDGTPIGSAERT